MKTNVIPQLIVDHFGVTSNSIYTKPAHAAAATMGFLIELSDVLMKKKHEYPIELAGLNDQTLIDYLPYFYQGKGRRILKGETPDPEKNGYLKAVQNHVSQMYGQQLFCNIAVARERNDSAVTGSVR